MGAFLLGSTSMIVRANPAIRIAPPSDLTGGRWQVDDIVNRRRFTVSASAAAVLVAAFRPQEPEQIADRLAARSTGRPSEFWIKLIENLKHLKLVLDEEASRSDPQLSWLRTLRQNWSRLGWHEAAEYHVLSFDYPCVDYSEGAGMLLDRARMSDYQTEALDTDRYKLSYLDSAEVPLPAPDANLSEATARELWCEPPKHAVADQDSVSKALALTFGVTGLLMPRNQSAPLLRRSSPSGGGRHPSEGYLVARDVPGMEPGWYHITIEPFGLRRLDGLAVDDDRLSQLFAETVRRCPLDIRALVVITSVFERNMYRYREPRTFRTVHMDAGHLAGSLWLAARSLGLTAFTFLCDPAALIEEALGIDGLQEGYMLTVALADGAELDGIQLVAASSAAPRPGLTDATER